MSNDLMAAKVRYVVVDILDLLRHRTMQTLAMISSSAREIQATT
jgi:hypothetical protein